MYFFYIDFISSECKGANILYCVEKIVSCTLKLPTVSVAEKENNKCSPNCNK